MASVDPGAEFSLTYEVQPDDLGEIWAAEPEMRRLRTRAVFSTVLLALLCALLTAFTVVVEFKSVAERSSGVPGWIYVVDLVLWGLVIWGSFIHLAPGHETTRQARLAGQCPAPRPPPRQARPRGHSLHLIDYHGAVRVALPKRGLGNPDLLPALREFLIRSTGGQSLAATLGTAAGEPRP